MSPIVKYILSLSFLTLLVQASPGALNPTELVRRQTSGLTPSNVPTACTNQCSNEETIAENCASKSSATAEATCLCTSTFENAAVQCLNCLLSAGALPGNELPAIQQSLDFFRQSCAQLGANLPSVQIGGSQPPATSANVPTPSPSLAPSATFQQTDTTAVVATFSTPVQNPPTTSQPSIPSGLPGFQNNNGTPAKAVEQGLALIVFFASGVLGILL